MVDVEMTRLVRWVIYHYESGPYGRIHFRRTRLSPVSDEVKTKHRNKKTQWEKYNSQKREMTFAHIKNYTFNHDFQDT